MMKDYNSKENLEMVRSRHSKPLKTYQILNINTILAPDKIKYLTLIDATKIWMPDTFFRNEKIGRFHEILTPNLYVRVFPGGDVLYSIR